MNQLLRITAITASVLMFIAAAAEAGPGKSVAKTAAARLLSRAPKVSTAVLKRDLERDLATKAVRLRRPATVFRYTTRNTARLELKKGIAPNLHMTSRARPGRPLLPVNARQRFGLRKQPSVRMTISLKPGQPIRFNRALKGAPGIGEITSPRRVAPANIKRVVPLVSK